jgi:hypothetical protein
VQQVSSPYRYDEIAVKHLPLERRQVRRPGPVSAGRPGNVHLHADPAYRPRAATVNEGIKRALPNGVGFDQRVVDGFGRVGERLITGPPGR